jgi:predicted neuraminidase
MIHLETTNPTQTEIQNPTPIVAEHKLWPAAVQHNCKTGSLVETASGDILAAWYGAEGTTHGNTALWTARFTAGKWQQPELVRKYEGQNVWNPVFVKKADGNLALFFRTYHPEGDDTHRYKRTFTYSILHSSDDGKNWSEDTKLPEGITGASKCSPLILSDTSWLVPSSVPLDNENHRAVLLHTADEGKNWTTYEPILREDATEQMTEPCLVQTKDKTIHIFLRDRQKQEENRRVMHATFDLTTKKVSVATATNVENPDTGIDVVSLPPGRLLMAANPCTKGRSPLSLLISSDNGANWEKFVDLETGKGSFSQPALLLARDGKLHAIYSFWHNASHEKNIKHLVIHI